MPSQPVHLQDLDSTTVLWVTKLWYLDQSCRGKVCCTVVKLSTSASFDGELSFFAELRPNTLSHRDSMPQYLLRTQVKCPWILVRARKFMYLIGEHFPEVGLGLLCCTADCKPTRIFLGLGTQSAVIAMSPWSKDFVPRMLRSKVRVQDGPARRFNHRL